MKARWALLLAAAFSASCGGGGGGSQQGSFRLIQFLEQGQNRIPRNRVLTFLFSAPVADGQDFAERLKIQNTQGNPNSNFSLAIGTYEPVGDRVTFAPRLPNKEDRSDAGFREDGEYTVFLKAGPDALVSTGGDPISSPQEMLFDTSEFFEDPFPAEPPRVEGLFARDSTQLPSAPRVDIGRLDPRPGEQALLDNEALIAATRVIEPGAGGAPQFATPWRFELDLSEPLDPSTVTTDNIELLEIYSGATTSGEAAPPFAPDAWFGTPVNFKVPVNVTVEQQVLEDGSYDVKIVVEPLGTLVDNTRYRLVFGGNILGIDFRQQFIGANGLTGDGETVLSGATPYPEPGGLGYTAEFIVRDRPAITAKRTLTYDPVVDNVSAEIGQTTNDPDQINTALYNPASSPSTALGFLGAFGNGSDGNLAVTGGTMTIDTGDTPNSPSGISITVTDLDYQDSYSNQGSPTAGTRTVAGLEPLELQLENLTVSASSTLRIVGVNPFRILVTGLVQIKGTVDASGSAGEDGSLSLSDPGAGGPGGFAGGRSPKGDKSCPIYGGNDCSTFDGFLNMCAGAKAKFPFALKGKGPGRGNQGGDSQPYWAQLNSSGVVASGDNTATGGGGGSHAASGSSGEDRINAGGAPGTAGPSCSSPSSPAKTPNSSVIGARGMPGPTYGDPTARDWMGGSGGGGGGSVGEHTNAIGAYGTSGGGGGGGGGFFEIVSAGPILVTGGGKISVAGGRGGAGYLEPNISPQYGTTYQTSWNTVTGGGGGGAGGSISLVSASEINVSAGLLDALGGAGGIRGSNPLAGGTLNGPNAGGEGGKGFIFLMDPDGLISGLLPNGAGTYPTFTGGYLTISTFATAGDRFGDTRAVTELFNIPAANPAYLEFDPANDILANVNNVSQQIFIYASSAKADVDSPLDPNVASEIPEVLVARVHFSLGATQVDTSYDAMDLLNPAGPNRDAYIRINALFEYANLVEAALGPIAYMDRVDITYSFNG